MNNHEKDAIATFVSQVVKAVKSIMDLASKLWSKIKECYDIATSHAIGSEKKLPQYIRIPSHTERTFRQSSGSHIGNSLKIERAHQTDQRHPALRRIGGIRHGKG
ncbi:hypothetical protein [Exiguobacterium sp. USCH10]|uniref:hypothetical protein n=1 Tax=Exiguobacterium sp. USCH10 TaxID=3024839 RepID=UPI0030ACAF04